MSTNAAIKDQIRDVGATPGAEAVAPFFDDLKSDRPEIALLLEHAATANLLTRVFVCSPYLRGIILRSPNLMQDILTTQPEMQAETVFANLAALHDRALSQTEIMQQLRHAKRRIALLTALADIGGVWPVMQITDILAQFADAASQAALRYAYRASQVDKRTARERAQAAFAPPQQVSTRAVETSGLFVIAMGKHGAFELNYSSDIDLIVFYDPAAQPDISAQQQRDEAIAATRLFVKLMQEQTADGYVFRTDLRLRPDPGSTPVAMSIDAAFQYYESFGQNWERAAFIKARAIAGDVERGEQFLAELQPYIWRRHLDHAAIRDIHAMKRQIATHRGFEGIDIPGHNIKLGPGGIREIEFFAQTKQLTAGGRQPELRVPATLAALDALTERGWIEASDAATLHNAYLYLRMVEHRLQMVADAQTHTMPADDAALHNIAIFCGEPDTASFIAKLKATLESVRATDSDLFGDEADSLASTAGPLSFTGTDADEATLKTLSDLGYKDPAAVIDLVKSWHFGRTRATQTEKARVVLTDLQPKLVQALAATDTPDTGLLAFDKALRDVGNGLQFFSSLNQNPDLLRLLTEILGTSPRLADLVARNPHMLDALLDPAFFGQDFSQSLCVDALNEQLDQATAFEDLLDRARIAVHEQQFLVGTRLLSNTADAGEAAQGYTCLADTVVARLFEACQVLMRERHGAIPGGEASLLAMGSWGAREMNAGSDIDLIMIYDAPAAATGSDGDRPLSVTEYYARLTKRLITAVTAQLPTGKLYEIDTRLRPSGHSGPLATSLESFIKYQNKDAWTWEHMALTRARVIGAPSDLAQKLNAEMRAIFNRPRDASKIANDVREMRERLRVEKGTANPWDIKQRDGGLIDIEFITQYLQLTNSGLEIRGGTRAMLPVLEGANLLTKHQAETLIAANELYATLIQTTRLSLTGPFDPGALPAGFARNLMARLGMSSAEELTEKLDHTAAQISVLFNALIPETS